MPHVVYIGEKGGGKKSEIWFRFSTSVAFEALWFWNEVT